MAGSVCLLSRLCSYEGYDDYCDLSKVVPNLNQVVDSALKSGHSEFPLYVSTEASMRVTDDWRYYTAKEKISRHDCLSLLGLLSKLNGAWVNPRYMSKGNREYTHGGRYALKETRGGFVLTHHFSLTPPDSLLLSETQGFPRTALYFLDKRGLKVINVMLDFSPNYGLFSDSYFTEQGKFASCVDRIPVCVLERIQKTMLSAFRDIRRISHHLGFSIDYLEMSGSDFVDLKTNERTVNDVSIKDAETFYLYTSNICPETGSWDSDIVGNRAVAITF